MTVALGLLIDRPEACFIPAYIDSSQSPRNPATEETMTMSSAPISVVGMRKLIVIKSPGLADINGHLQRGLSDP